MGACALRHQDMLPPPEDAAEQDIQAAYSAPSAAVKADTEDNLVVVLDKVGPSILFVAGRDSIDVQPEEVAKMLRPLQMAATLTLPLHVAALLQASPRPLQ